MPDPAATGIPSGSRRGPTVFPLAASSARQPAMTAFLDAAGWRGIVPTPLAGDASFRRYFRVRRGRRSAVVMDAPPPHEAVGPFVAVAAILRDLGLSVPLVLAENRAEGFLLIEDFGDNTYTRLLRAGADEPALYTLAIDALVALQRAVEATAAPALPPYDMERLLGEAALLADWYMPSVLGQALSPALRQEYLALWRAVLAEIAAPLRPTMVLRDFHVDNLMLLPRRPGVRSCGLLDFQDAVLGSPAYDLVSLLADARRDVSPELRRAMIERYLAAFPASDRTSLHTSAAILAAQRNCKILGIFTRLWKRDGKSGYLVHIPRLWRLLEADLRHPALAGVERWIDRHLPPPSRRPPDPRGQP